MANDLNYPDEMLTKDDPLNPNLVKGQPKYTWDLDEQAVAASPGRKTQGQKKKNGTKRFRYVDEDGVARSYSDEEDSDGKLATTVSAPKKSLLAEDGDADESNDGFEEGLLNMFDSLIDQEEKAEAKPTPAPAPAPTPAPAPAKKTRAKRPKLEVPSTEQAEIDRLRDNMFSTLDAPALVDYIDKRIGELDATVTDLGFLERLVCKHREVYNAITQPLVAFGNLIGGTTTGTRIEEGLRRLISTNERMLRVVNVLQRAQTSHAIDNRRLCRVVVSLINSVVSSHEIRRMPLSRNDLVRPVYVPTHRDDVVRLVAPPPLHNAAIGETILSETEAVRLVRADITPSQRSVQPSQRPNIVTMSMVRSYWAPQDTALAWRITRACAAADTIREQRARRVHQRLLTDAVVVQSTPGDEN